MGKFSEFKINGRVEPETLFEKLKHGLPTFQWRMGDSDAAGPYIKGYHPDNTDVAIWLGEVPYDLTINSRRSTIEAAQIEGLETKLLSLLAALNLQMVHS